MNPKFCKDCRWLWSPGANYDHKCLSPKIGRATGHDLVTGEQIDKPLIEYCAGQRDGSWEKVPSLGVCGSEGRFFEPKVTP